jgi:hypothetical protein
MLTTAMLTEIKNYIAANAGYARFTANGTVYRVELNKAELDASGRVIISFTIDHTYPENITITKVQLYNKRNVLWADKAENILRKSTSEGIHYRFALTVTES